MVNPRSDADARRRALLMERYAAAGRFVPGDWAGFIRALERERPTFPSVDNGYRPSKNGRANRKPNR